MGGQEGTYQLEIYESVTTANTNCSGAITIDNSVLPYVAGGSTVGLPSVYSACSSASLGGLWYKIAGTAMNLMANTCDDSVDFDTVIEVYSGCSAGVASGCIGSNDDFCDESSQFTWESQVTATYYIFVTGYEGHRGSFVLTVDEVADKPHADCTYAIEIPRVPWAYSDSTSGVPASYSSCLLENKRSLWFVVEGNGNVLIATTCYENNVGHDTVIEIYDNCENHNETGCVNYNDDYCGLYSQATWSTAPGREYWIAVSGYRADISGVNFTLTLANQQTVSNDECWFAQTITLPSDYSQTTTNSDWSYGDCNAASSQRKGRWFQYAPEDTVQVTATTCSNLTTASGLTIEVYSSCTLISCAAQSSTVCGDKASVTWSALKGRQYMIFVVTPVGGDPGFFHIQFYNSQPVNHSTCENALALKSVPYTGTGDTLSTIHAYDRCLQQQKQGVWYTVVGTGNKMRADTCGGYTDFDTIIEVYSGCGPNACMNYNDDTTSCGRASMVEFNTDLGATYYIFITGFGDTTGVFSLNVFDVGAPSNSLCTTPYEIVGDVQTVWDYTYYATPSTGDCTSSATGKGLWYRVSGDNQYIDISTCSSDNLIDTNIQVFTGCSNGAGTGCNNSLVPDHTCGHAHLIITSPEKKGKPQYWYVFIQGSNTAEGLISTTFTRTAMPGYDSDDDEGLSGGAIAGVIFGVMFGVAAIGAGCAIGFMWWQKRGTYTPLGGTDAVEPKN